METQVNFENIIKQPIHLQEQGDLMSIEQIKQSFDFIIRKIDENNTLLTDKYLMKEIVELAIHSNEKNLCDPTIINHRVFFILRDYYLNLIQYWRFGEKFDDISFFIFETISNLFLKMSSHISDNN
ncbi:unnamed protein product, partial [Rotaria sp. Silwood1]